MVLVRNIATVTTCTLQKCGHGCLSCTLLHGRKFMDSIPGPFKAWLGRIICPDTIEATTNKQVACSLKKKVRLVRLVMVPCSTLPISAVCRQISAWTHVRTLHTVSKEASHIPSMQFPYKKRQMQQCRKHMPLATLQVL